MHLRNRDNRRQSPSKSRRGGRLIRWALLAAAPLGLAGLLDGGSAKAFMPMCMSTWDGGAGSNSFHDPVNWMPDGIPTMRFCIPLDKSVEHSAGTTDTEGAQIDGTLSVIGGTLNFTSTLIHTTVNGTLSISGTGTVGGAADIDVFRFLTFKEQGAWAGPGLGLVAEQALVVIGDMVQDAGDRTLDGRTIENFGTVQVLRGDLRIGGGAAIVNRGTLELNDSSRIVSVAGQEGTVENTATGVVRKIGAGDASILVPFTNAGEVNVQGGILTLGPGGVAHDTGPYIVDAGTKLNFNWDRYIDWSVTGGGTMVISGGHIHVDTPAPVSVLKIRVDAGVLCMPRPQTIPNLEWLGGSVVGGGGDITITESLGVFGPDPKALTNANVLVASGATYDFADTGITLAGSILGLNGRGTFRASSIWLGEDSSGSVVMTNVMEVIGPSGIEASSVIGAGAKVNVMQGTLALGSGGPTPDVGAYNVSPGATLRFTGDRVIDGSIQSAGEIRIGPPPPAGTNTVIIRSNEVDVAHVVVDYNGVMEVTGQVTLRGITITGGTVIAETPLSALDALLISGGGVFRSTAEQTVQAVTLQGGSIISRPQMAMFLNRAFGLSWPHDSRTPGSPDNTLIDVNLTVRSGATYDFSGSTTTLSNSTLTLDGSGRIEDASLLPSADPASRVNINGSMTAVGVSVVGVPTRVGGNITLMQGGMLDLHFDGMQSGDIRAARDATLRLSGNWTQLASSDITSKGLIEILSGTATIQGRFLALRVEVEDLGELRIRPGAAVIATLAIESGGRLTGDGTVQGDVLNSGTVSPGTGGAGRLTVGSYEQTDRGSLVLDVLGRTPVTEYDQVLVTGDARIDGTLQVNTTQSQGFPAPGDVVEIVHSDGTLTGRFRYFFGDPWDANYDTHWIRLSVPFLPGSPRGFHAIPEIDGDILLSWLQPQSDGGSPVINYRIYRGPLGGPMTFIAMAGGEARSYSDPGCPPLSLCAYHVTAVNRVGEGPPSNDAIMLSLPRLLPDAPASRRSLE